MEVLKSQSSEPVFLQQATKHFMLLPDDSYLLKEINTQSWKRGYHTLGSKKTLYTQGL